MPKINEAERLTQERVLNLFQNPTFLGYAYYGNLRNRTNNNIDADKLKTWLTSRGYSRTLSDKAVFDLQKAAGNLQQGLYKANQNVYSLLKYGAKVKESPGEPEQTVYFIDWEHSHNNEFAIAEAVSYTHLTLPTT